MNIAFLTLTPVIGVAGTAIYTWYAGFSLWMPLLTVGMYLAVGISICAGYHRFFSHKTYEAHPAVQVFYAIFGAMAAQNSILWWSSSHRVHHKYVDRDWDPYNIQRGFWWAHILWVFYRNDQKPHSFENSPDLLKNRIVMWQHRWHKVILIAGGFGLPTLIGAAFGDPIAGLLWGGFLRIAVIHHTTFFVNSLAHMLGKPSYNAEVSARDNWAVALLTLGEGYHSFHHRFPADFRNGIRWYQWDPAKWFIAGLRGVGLAEELRTTAPPQIEQARLQAALRVVEPRIASINSPTAAEIRRRIDKAVEHIERAVALWRQHMDERAAGLSHAWKASRRRSRRYLRQARRQWKGAMRIMARLPEAPGGQTAGMSAT
ncbi:MAG TPA: fatty acid desaturase [Thermoanaerobaculia bacterium]|nr:fatty acid desaturase [Thermoanaerobaculia bacterium]